MDKKPVLNGLILAGGKSRRMGSDKALLSYDSSGELFIENLYSILSKHCNDVYFSLSQQTQFSLPDNYKIIKDLQEPIGPMGGLISAFNTSPNAAWFVIACDMPRFDEATLSFLLDKRLPENQITVFKNLERNAVEPLCAIYEPTIKEALMEFYNKGGKSLSRFINTHDHLAVEMPSQNPLLNINTKEEYLLEISNNK